MSISRTAHILWRWLTEPAASILEPEERQRARAIAAILLLAAALIFTSFLQYARTTAFSLPWALMLILVIAAYGLCRTRYFRQGTLLAIAALWLLPTYIVAIFGLSNIISLILSVGRLLLVALLLAYILFSLRASLILTLFMVIAFLFAPSAALNATSPLQRTVEFVLASGSIFFILVIMRQYDLTQRQEAEAALGASEARYRAIVENQIEMICRWLPDGTVTFANAACCRYFGITREAMIGRNALAPVFEEDRPLVNQMIAHLSHEQPVITYQFRVVNPAGEVRWHEWTDQAIFNDAGQLVEYQSVGRDIHELKRAEEAEREQREFSEALTSTAALITSTLDLDEVLDRILNQVAVVNPLNSAEILLIDNGIARIVRTKGYNNTADQAAIMGLCFPVHETRNLRTMHETGKPLIIPDVRDDPEWLDFELTRWIRASCGAPIRLEGETIGILNITSTTPGIFTEQHAERLQAFADQAAIAIRNARLYDAVRRQADELEAQVKERTAELELERQRLRAILDGTGEGMFYTEDDQIQFANVAFCKLTGYTPDELVGQNYSRLYSGDKTTDEPAILEKVRAGLRNQGVWRGEFRFLRKDDSLVDVGLTISLIGSSSARPFRAVTVVRDISRERALQIQRSTFVAYASHELRTPITNMKTRLYLLRRRPELLEDHLVILDEVTERMSQLVDDLFNMSRLEHGLIPIHREEITVQSVIKTVITLEKPEAELHQLDFRWTLPEEPIRVAADRDRLIQAITNLVTNAIIYTPAGGTVNITLKCLKGSAQIEVEDTGIGIAPENLPHIFQPFYRVVSVVEGTGLGLSIAKEIVEQHEGTLAVRSERNRGSVFTITLPLLEPLHTG